MENKHKKKKILMAITCLLIIIECTTVFLMYKSLSNKDATLDEVKLVNNPNNSGMFAIMLENTNGEYELSENNVWPTSNYVFNATRSGCMDVNGKEVAGALEFSNGVAKLKTNKKVTCYLYFSIDSTSPSTFIFYAGGSTNPTYTNSATLNSYLVWTDTDVASYCITNTAGSDSCTWNTANGTTATAKHTLTTGDGTKTVYAYLKDNTGNVSETVSDTITLDTTAPTIDSATQTDNKSTSVTVTITSTESLSGIDSYYYKIGDGTYTSSTSQTHTFTGLSARTTYSVTIYAVDNAGNTSVEKTISVTTNYSFGEYLIDNPTSGFNSSIEGGMYRYQGTSNVLNYVCFGTTDKNTCTSSPGKYMYRIIGVVGTKDSAMGTDVNMVKIIKKEALDISYPWNSETYVDAQWNPNAEVVATLLTGINGTYFYTSAEYDYLNNTSWSDKMADIKWRYGDISNRDVTAESMYTSEIAGTVPTTSKKISLMYLHDYYYAYRSGGVNCGNSGTYGLCQDSWLHLSQNDSGAPKTVEWVMTRSGYDDTNNVFAIQTSGRPAGNFYSGTYYSVRPVFYLTTDVMWSSGTGTSSDPFIIG